MAGRERNDLPDLTETLARLLARVPPEERPLLIAIAERLAAERYRRWANESTDASRKAELLACARREEEIAGRIEALYPGAAAIQRDIRGKNPDLDEFNRAIFAERSLPQQFAIQAQGERLGAATWRAFAASESASARREAFLTCAELEEESALVLESILGARR